AWGNGFLHCKKINLLPTGRQRFTFGELTANSMSFLQSFCCSFRRTPCFWSGACTRNAVLQMLFSILPSLHQLLDVLILIVHQSTDFLVRQCAVYPQILERACGYAEQLAHLVAFEPCPLLVSVSSWVWTVLSDFLEQFLFEFFEVVPRDKLYIHLSSFVLLLKNLLPCGRKQLIHFRPLLVQRNGRKQFKG